MKKWINNGIKHTFVDENELQFYLNDGWQLGMLPSHSRAVSEALTGEKIIS